MTRSPKHLLIGGILLVALAASGTVVAYASSSAVKITNCTAAASAPKTLVLTCADANTRLRSLRWSSFGGATARARGSLETNTCTPNCASGKFVTYPVTVRATGVRACKRHLRVYKRLALVFTARKPSSAGSLSHWTLRCPT